MKQEREELKAKLKRALDAKVIQEGMREQNQRLADAASISLEGIDIVIDNLKRQIKWEGDNETF